jgi:hypothetical protein
MPAGTTCNGVLLPSSGAAATLATSTAAYAAMATEKLACPEPSASHVELSHVTCSGNAFSAIHQPSPCNRRHVRTRTDRPPYVREGRRDHQKAASKFNSSTVVRDLHTRST